MLCLLEVFGISVVAGGPSSLSCAMVWFGFLQSLLLQRKGNYPKGPKYLYYCIIVECPVSILGNANMIWESIPLNHPKPVPSIATWCGHDDSQAAGKLPLWGSALPPP